MSQTQPVKKHKILEDIPFLIAVFRGITAVFLGLVLYINPDKSRVLLGNFMGFFWLSSSFLLLHKDADTAFKAIGKRTSIVLGLVLIVTGLLVVTRRFTEPWVGRGYLVQGLGLVILLTGVLHVIGEVRVGLLHGSGSTIAHFVLGIFEIVLGGMLFLSPLSFSPLMYLMATIWALVGGCLIIGTAVYDRYKSHHETQS